MKTILLCLSLITGLATAQSTNDYLFYKWNGTAFAKEYKTTFPASTLSGVTGGTTGLQVLAASSASAARTVLELEKGSGGGAVPYWASDPIIATGLVAYNSGMLRGIIPGAGLNWDGTALSVDGSAVTSINASNITSGSLALTRIAQGGATSGQALVWNGSAYAPATVSAPSAVALTGLSVLAHFDFADSRTVWADASRTVPAQVGGVLRAVTDLSGNGNHGEFTVNCVWDGSAAQVYAEAASTLKVASLSWDAQNICVIRVWEPLTMTGNQSTVAYVQANSTNNPIAWMSCDQGTLFNGAIASHVMPSQRQIYVTRDNASSHKVWVNTTTASVAAAWSSGTHSGLWLGHGTQNAQTIAAYILRRVVVCTAASASDTNVAAAITELSASSQWPNIAPSTTANYFIVGDSLSVGYGSGNQPYWRQLMSTNGSIRFWPGHLRGQPAGGGATVQTPRAGMGTIDRIIYWLGYNDANGNRTASAIQADIEAYVTARAPTPVTVMTIAPNTALTGGKATVAATVNTWIRSTYPTNHIDLDNAGLVTGDYYDSVHLKASGQRKVAVMVAAHLGLNAPP